ncbi:MAG: STY4851/ECs_5259 family protein [Bacteroidota bacterium]
MKSPSEFLTFFINSKNLSSPDGRPLYGYKISDGTYQALKTILKDYWDGTKECHACFVLYVVEFLRADFDEGHLNWDSIFSEIEKTEFNQHNKRSAIVKEGLSYWDRPLFSTTSGIEYIESLRFESGLPNTCLNEKNNVSRLIRKSFQYLETYQIDELELINMIFADNLISYLPAVLRQETFYELVAKICIRFLELKINYNLGQEDNPIDRLSTVYPQWKEGMPLKISGQNMEAFFDHLVSEISKAEKLDRQVIQIVHELTQIDDQFSIKSLINVPQGIYSASAFSIEDTYLFEKLPGHFIMLFECGDLIKPLAYLSKTADGRISSKGLLIEFPVKVYGKDWKVGFSSNKKVIELYSGISRSFQMTPGEPLLFISDESNKWFFKGSGNQKVKQKLGKVLIPDSIHFKDQDHPESLAKTETGLSIYELSDSYNFINHHDQFEYKISFNEEKESVYTINLLDESFAHISQKLVCYLNPDTFFKPPRVYLYNSKFGINERYNGEIQVQQSGNSWKPINEVAQYGLNKLRFLNASGEIIGYQKITLLPEDFRVKIDQRLNQILILTDTKLIVHPERNDTSINVSYEDGTTIIDLETTSLDASPYLYFLLVFEDNQSMKIKLPNPAVHEVFTNSVGEIINRKHINLDEIHGNALNINNFSDQEIKKYYSLKLVGQQYGNNEVLDIRRSIPVPAFSSVRGPLFHWLNELNTLLTLNESVDAAVKISSSQPHHYVEIKRFEYSPKIHEGKLFIDEDYISSEIQICAFPLNQGFSKENIHSVHFDSELDVWNLESSLPEGLWFVYSSKESERMVRPKLFINQIEKPEINSQLSIANIHEACWMSFKDRQAKLIDYFNNKHNQFDDRLWQELYNLHQETKHLPFDTLDVWKALVKSEKGMLTFLLSNWVDEDLITNLAREFSFSWRLIPIDLWTDTLQNWYLENQQSPAFEHIMSYKTGFIQSELEFSLIKQIIQGSRIEISEKDFILSLTGMINGDGNAGLRIKHGEGTGKWPTLASDYIKEKYKLMPNYYRSIIPGQFANWQKPVIYLPVIMAYQSVYGNMINQTELDPKTKLSLWLTAEFDQDYFKSAFDLCQSFFYSKKTA